MKLRLTDGSIVLAASRKDCQCSHHTGPHWIHMDAVTRELNRKLLKQGTVLSLQGFAKEELARLANKKQAMLAAGVVEIIRGTPGEVVEG